MLTSPNGAGAAAGPAPWRVLVTARRFNSTPEALDVFARAGCEVVPSDYGSEKGDHDLGGDELVALLQDVDAIAAGSCQLTRDVIERAPRLKVISRRGVGYDSIDLEAARERNVLVAIAAGTNNEAVADHVFALMLASARRLFDAHRSLLAGEWISHTGVALQEKTLGIVGLGRIGKGVARRAHGFDLRVIATDPVWDDAFAANYGVERVTFEALLERSDIVSVNASYNPSTHRLIDAAALARMKPAALFINTSRGPIVHEAALATALREGRIAAAAVDVFEEEPPVGTPLRDAPNVILTPHSAGDTVEAAIAANVVTAETIVGMMRGELPRSDRIIVRPGRVLV
jgi:D-3-phosphoglycerate dehydrogenase